jgi:hypothetical protein
MMATPGQSTLFTTFTELVTTTYRNHKAEISDNVSEHNALYKRLTNKGRVRREDGGLSIVCNLDYAENSTYQRYSGYDALNVNASEVLSAAEFPWRQQATHVTASGLEIRSNSGENRIVNLVKSRIKNAQRTMANNLSEDFYSAGSLSNQINGLQALIADAGTGTVGGINSSTFTFWQNTVQSAAAPLQGGGAIVPSATTIESLMLPLFLRTTRGADVVDLIVMSEDYFTFYEQSQTSLKRYAPEDNGKGGMISMKYKTADVFWDSSASGIPAAHGYFVNTDFMEVVVHQDADMEIMPEMRAINQDAIVIPVIHQCNLVISNRKRQGVMKA